MGDQVKVMMAGEEIPVEPIGNLLANGWLPGTWVTYSATPASKLSGAIVAVERSDGTGLLNGFLRTGPQHNQPVERLSDMWTTDQRQRDGGDTHADWGPNDAGGVIQFDEQNLLQKLGTRIATMIITPTGFHRFYVYETEDLAERTTPGSGSVLTYTPADLLYVSSRGRLTNEKETGAHAWTGYVVAKANSDTEGDYLIVTAGMI